MTISRAEYKAAYARERNARGLCRDCPGELTIYKGRCETCMDKHRRANQRYTGCKPWVRGRGGCPRLDDKSDEEGG